LLTGAALEGPFDAAILATYSPLDALVWQRARARVRVYDCYDENVHFHSAGSRAAAMVEQTEDRVTRQADLVLASTPQLQERLAARHRRVVLVPNAADAEHFSPKQDQPEPAELQGIAGPILGFVGVIQSWVDIDLIARVAQLLEGWTIVLVGPIERDVAALQALANVRLLGRKPYDALPAFVRRFDVGMIPFALNELTRAVDPVKFYEYCAAGKPVVSTPLPSMRGRSNVVYLAASAGEMATQVRRALAEDNRERRAFRLDIAARNSWASRAELILREIERAAGKSSEH
jgi:glycosyltransferase involved in cell wall biosynthesis